jgi:methylmalonyl-CoA mutase
METPAREYDSVSFAEFAPTSYVEWRREAEDALKGAPFEKRLLTKTYEGITLEPLYTAEHTKDLTHPRTHPGSPDFLRGTEPAGYLAAPWAVAQACDAALPWQANEQLRQELARGSDAIHVALDGATLRCRDEAEPGAESSRGLSLATLRDIDETFRDIDLASTPLHIFAGASAAPLLALLVARTRAQGALRSVAEFGGCVGADPLGVLAREGMLDCPLGQLYDEMALTIQWTRTNMPRMRTIFVRGDVYHDGGANAAQEIACAMATAVSYLDAMRLRGIDADSVASQMRFSFSLGANFFMEIAKLRAVRMVWSQIAEAFGCGEGARKIDIFATTSAFTKTVYDPYVNILRNATEAFSGVVGGVGGMNVRGFDDAVRSGDEQSRRISRNIQILLRNEFELLQPVDPAGGSWYIESLTESVAELAWAQFQKIEQAGGMQESLRSGAVQAEIEAVLQARFKNLSTRSDRAVGSNMYANTTEQPLAVPNRDENAMREIRRLAVAEYRETVDDAFRREQLERIPDSIGGAEGAFLNVLVDAFLAGATLGDVRRVLDDGFDGDERVTPIRPHRWTERFEALRRATEEFVARTGENVSVFLANMGPVAQHKARADFSTGFMEVAGFRVLKNDGFATVNEAARAACDSGVDVVVICSTDDTYPELVPPLARAIRAERPGVRILLAGAPAPECRDAYTEAGVDDFIHVRADCLRILRDIQTMRGMA